MFYAGNSYILENSYVIMEDDEIIVPPLAYLVNSFFGEVSGAIDVT